MRSPSPCEARLDKQIRDTIRDAFAAVRTGGDGWVSGNETEDKSIIGVGTHSEDLFFSLGATDVGGYSIQLSLNESSPAFAAAQRKYQQASQGDGSAASIARLMDATREWMSSLAVVVAVAVNQSSTLIDFKGKLDRLDLPGATYALRGLTTQGGGGGDITNSKPTTVIYLGRWKAPVVEHLSDGGLKEDLVPDYPPSAPHLSVQAIVIRIEGSLAQSDKVVKLIDYAKLKTLLTYQP